MNSIKSTLIVIVLGLMMLLTFGTHPISAGSNGQQLDIRICDILGGHGLNPLAPHVAASVQGYNQYGELTSWYGESRMYGCTVRTKGFWWVGRVNIQVYKIDAAGVSATRELAVDVPKNQRFDNWYVVK